MATVSEKFLHPCTFSSNIQRSHSVVSEFHIYAWSDDGEMRGQSHEIMMSIQFT